MKHPLLLLALVAATGFAQDSTYTGSLERVMENSVTILLTDGRLVDARLPGRKGLTGAELVAQFSLADHVKVDYKRIPYFRDPITQLPCMFELARIKFLRKATPEEFLIASKNADWRVPGNLLAVSSNGKTLETRPPSIPNNAGAEPLAGTALTLDRIREVNLQRAAHLPNFIADEVTECYFSNAGPVRWEHTSSIRSEVSFKGSGETRKNMITNGEPDPTGSKRRCIGYGGGFGTYLVPIFDPECPSGLAFSRKIGKPGNEGLALSFRSPPEGCFYTSFSGSDRAYPVHEGLVLIESPGGNMIHVAERSVQFPAAYGITSREEKVTWDFVKIGDATHLLPVSYEKIIYNRGGSAGRVTVKYTNHRHFEADTSITFQPPQ